MNENYYELLGLTKDANQDEIKRAYRTLSKKFHPDLNPNNKQAEEQFKKISEAYNVLSDPNKKNQYDNRGRGFQGFGPFGQGGMNFDIFNDFFNFNHSQNRNQPRKGSDLRIKLNFTLEEIINGSIKNLKYSRKSVCDACTGNGSKNGNSYKSCNNCNGQGVVLNIVQTPFGRIQTSSPCNVCSGTGRIINEICNKCGANGIIDKNESIELKVPPGIVDGFTYKIEGGGNYANSSDSYPGDLIIICQIIEHQIYKKLKNDLHRDVFISFFDAIVGIENYSLDYFGDEIKVRIEPNTDNGKILRLKGKGLSHSNGTGDLYLHINIFIPKNIDSSTLEVLDQIKEKIRPKNELINPEIGFLNKSLKINSLYNN